VDKYRVTSTFSAPPLIRLVCALPAEVKARYDRSSMRIMLAKQPDSYQAARHGDFHTVGDIAYRDEEGYYYICDRKNDMIISGGMNIYPAEIEATLEQHPGIFDVAVFGIPSDAWGEQVHATVVLAPGAPLTGADVIAYAHEHLAGYKCPRSVSFATELPRTGSGKLLKRKLRAPYWAGRTTQVS